MTHSTEADFEVFSDICIKIDRGRITELVLLDFCAALDTVDYDVLKQENLAIG